MIQRNDKGEEIVVVFEWKKCTDGNWELILIPQEGFVGSMTNNEVRIEDEIYDIDMDKAEKQAIG